MLSECDEAWPSLALTFTFPNASLVRKPGWALLL